MRVVDKATALALLDAERQRLLSGGLGCVPCALAERTPASDVLAEDQHGKVVLDRFGARPGHLLVLARRHVERTTELSWPEYSALQRLAFLASRALERAVSPQRVFIASLGAPTPLPMTFPHFHLHVIPVHETDERARPAAVFSWSSGVVIYDDQEARELIGTLRRALRDEGAARTLTPSVPPECDLS